MSFKSRTPVHLQQFLEVSYFYEMWQTLEKKLFLSETLLVQVDLDLEHAADYEPCGTKSKSTNTCVFREHPVVMSHYPFGARCASRALLVRRCCFGFLLSILYIVDCMLEVTCQIARLE